MNGTNGAKDKARPPACGDNALLRELLLAQRTEITEYLIYRKLAGALKNPDNRRLLLRIAEDEIRHYNFWKRRTGRDAKPYRLQLWKYYLIARILGVTFGVKLMERGESTAQIDYRRLAGFAPEAYDIAEEEEEHERELVNMINEERLAYIGSIVLGLNDALVELTGALAGLTLALRETRLIAVAGLITGISASLSMAASEYLSTGTEEDGRNPLKASVYTGLAYVFTVVVLILPYFLLPSVYAALAVTVSAAIAIIFLFTFYISVAKEISFRKRFAEMALMSLGVAAISFGIGYLVRIWLGVEA